MRLGIVPRRFESCILRRLTGYEPVMPSSWDQPKHHGARHNRAVRGRGTWSTQDRRLKRHLHGRIYAKRGFFATWTSQVHRIDARKGRTNPVIVWIVAAGAIAVAVSIGGNVLIGAAVAVLAALAWRRIRPH